MTLTQILPNAKPGTLSVVSNNIILSRYKINTGLRKAAFFAQLAHETGGFRWLHELGNDAYFKKYDGRMGNGIGEGAKYKGRGFIQLTGKNNYKAYGNRLKIDLVNKPWLAEDLKIALQIACLYWADHNLNAYADKKDMATITKRINGGLNGYEDRMNYYTKFMHYFGVK